METNTRRNFLKTLGVGGLTLSAPVLNLFHPQVATSNERTINVQAINDFEFEFVSDNKYFLGIGNITIGNIRLRSNRLPMFIQVTTPDAIEFCDFEITSKLVTTNEIRFDFKVSKHESDLMEWMLHTVRNRRRLPDWSNTVEPADDVSISMVIKPVERQIGKITAKGFSYEYHYKSSKYPIYKITDRASWEIGGSAIGNEFWMRNGVIDCIKEFTSKDDFYSTEWYLPGIANPNIFQFHPLQTCLQGFTLTSANEGTLVTFPSKVSHIRSLFEKRHGYDEIIHFHEHCNDLMNEFSTVPVEVFWLPGKLNKVQRANLHYDTMEMVTNELHKQIGMKRERITTYGVIEEWTEPDFENYITTGLPKLLEAGVKTVFIPNQCENDMNTWGVSNMCCNVDYKISKTVGEDKLKKFCQAVKAGGAKVEMWGNTAISTLAERFMHHEGRKKGIEFLPYKDSIMEVIHKAEAPFIRNASNAIEADHYTPRFCVLNLRDKDIRTYWMKQWKYFLDEIGIEGIFLDSSFNLTCDKFHHAQFNDNKNWGGVTLDQSDLLMKTRPENEPPKLIHTQYHEYLSWVVEMQKYGYCYTGEDLGVFGVHRTGPEVVDRITSLSIWADSFCQFDEQAVKDAGYEPMEIFFKGLAYRMMWKIYWDFRRKKNDMGTDNPFAYKLIKVFNDVTDSMFNREVLPGESGVVYRTGKTSVLWAFTDFEFLVDKPLEIIDMVVGKPVEINSKSTLNAKKLTVYKISYS